MKKIIISVLTFLFSMCMIVPLAVEAYTIDDVYDGTHMDYEIWNYINNSLMPAIESNGNGNGASQESVNNVQNSIDNVQNSVNSIDLKKDMNDFFKEEAKINAEEKQDYPKSFMDGLMDVLETCWSVVPNLIKGNESGVWKISIDPAKQTTFTGIFQTIGYSLVLLFFAANLIENTIKYEIFTLKGGAMLFGRLIISKVVIDLSTTICTYILNICNKISSEILGDASYILKISTPNVESNSMSKILIIGPIIDFIQSFYMSIPFVLIILAMFAAALIIIFKLALRSIELSLLMIVSPAFFACYSSEITKPYFKNFIMTFIQCALQIVFMSVVYALSANWLTDITTVGSTAEAWAWFVKVLPNVLIALAFAIMMVKPPKVLTNLVK